MTKTQKIWFWVFLAMIIIPELLWSSIGNFAYQFFQNNNRPQPFRENFLNNPGNYRLLIFIMFIQFLGVLGATIILFQKKKRRLLGNLGIAVLTLLGLLTLFLLYLLFATGQIGA